MLDWMAKTDIRCAPKNSSCVIRNTMYYMPYNLWRLNMTKQLTPESSTIASIDHDGNKLIVEFKSGGTYHYDAPASVFEQMKASPSKGKFHHSDIKGKYGYTKI